LRASRRFQLSADHAEYQQIRPLTRRRKIVRDVGPTLSPDEELGDLAAAEAAVHARDEERGKDLDELQRELQGVLEFISLIVVGPPWHITPRLH
jgi:kinetochore protein Spc24